eukprot:sb/3477947/
MVSFIQLYVASFTNKDPSCYPQYVAVWRRGPHLRIKSGSVTARQTGISGQCSDKIYSTIIPAGLSSRKSRAYIFGFEIQTLGRSFEDTHINISVSLSQLTNTTQ